MRGTNSTICSTCAGMEPPPTPSPLLLEQTLFEVNGLTQKGFGRVQPLTWTTDLLPPSSIVLSRDPPTLPLPVTLRTPPSDRYASRHPVGLPTVLDSKRVPRVPIVSSVWEEVLRDFPPWRGLRLLPSIVLKSTPLPQYPVLLELNSCVSIQIKNVWTRTPDIQEYGRQQVPNR